MALISVTAKGMNMRLFYNGCVKTSARGEEPTVDECIKDSRHASDSVGNNAVHSDILRLPGDGGESATHMYISSTGLTVKQIRAFVSSLPTVN